MIFAIHQHELATGRCVSPPSWTPSHLLALPLPASCHRAPPLGSLHHTSNSHWLSVLHMVMHMFQCYFLKLSHEQYYLGILLVRNAIHKSHWAKNPGVSRIAFLSWNSKEESFSFFSLHSLAHGPPSSISNISSLASLWPFFHHSIFLTTGGSKYFPLLLRTHELPWWLRR